MIPWWLKLGVKVAVAATPLPYSMRRRIGIGRHGAMSTVDYAMRVFSRHYERARPYLGDGYSALELGPGDSLASAFLASKFGAASSYLVDVQAFAAADRRFYRSLCDELQVPFDEHADLAHSLARVRSRYMTQGLASLRALPSGSIDFVFSQAVLEHVRLDEFDATVSELFRLQRPGGIATHRIDLKDHLENGLHSLRFSRARWESPAFQRSSFYTNRLRLTPLMHTFERAGYEVVDCEADTWPRLPLARHKLDDEFAGMADEELLVSGIDVVLRKH